jgi:hypothetical protein
MPTNVGMPAGKADQQMLFGNRLPFNFLIVGLAEYSKLNLQSVHPDIDSGFCLLLRVDWSSQTSLVKPLPDAPLSAGIRVIAGCVREGRRTN